MTVQLPPTQRSTAISTKVFVGNLNFRTTEQQLADALSAAGQVMHVHMGTDRETGAGGQAGAAGSGLVAAWDQAVSAWEAVSEPYPLAQALRHAAEAALADGDRGGAADRLQRAAGLAAGLGANPLVEEIAALARRAGIRMTSPGDAPADSGAGDAGLTGRELEVLRLVAAGRSNRDIAAELFISPKTASVHVSNILGKLGAASRGEAAAKAHALRLFEPA